MAPGRRRGGKGANNKSQLSLGDLVLAKVKGFPPWPAKISKPEDWDKSPDPKKYFVYFFGTQEIAFVAPSDIQAFTNEAKSKLLARCRSKTVKHFAQAVKEICEAFEESQGKSSSAVNDEDEDRQDFGSDVHSAGGIVDDGMGTDGPNGETNYNSSGAQGPGLERCSHRLEEMEGQDMQRKEVSMSSPGRDFSSGNFISKEDCSGLDVKHLDDGKKMLVNGHKSKKTLTDSQRKSDGSFDKHKIRSPAAVTSLARGSSGGQLDLSVSSENHKDETRRRIASGDRLNESSRDVKKSKSDASVKKIKKILKDRIHNGGADNLLKDAEGSKEQEKVDLPGRKLKPELVKGKHNLVDDETVHPMKRSKCADDTIKGSQPPSRKSDVVVSKTANAELKRSTSHLRAENQMVPRRQPSSLPGDEDDLPPSKRRRRALEAMSDSTLVSEVMMARGSMTLKTEPSSGNLKSPAAQLPTKRRAVRLCDEEDEEEPKTPVHGGSVKRVDAPSHISNHAKTTAVRTENPTHNQSGGRNLGLLKTDSLKEFSSSAKVLGDSVSPSSQRPKKAMAEQVFRSPGNMKSEKISLKEIKPILVSSKCEQDVERPKKAIAGQVHTSPGNVDFEKISPMEVKQVLVSPKRSPLLADASLSVVEPLKANKPSGRVGNVMQKKAETSKDSGGTSDTLHHSQNQAPNERSMPVFSGERQRSTPVSSSWGIDASLVSGKPIDNNPLSGERLEAGKEDPASSLINSKDADSAKSMKLLIAAAQAKRRQAHSQSFSHDYVTSVQISVTDVSGGSPSSASAVHPILSGLSSMMQPDVQGYNPQTSYASPSSRLHLLASNTQPDSQEVEETITSSGHRPSVGSLSGGTEAAVARDAFEGMIETLSRTKDSIARATRLAIDCAKYGIANEVVELLIRKLESEPSFHKRVDLFFLVDSITQCSHSQKGIAGASYIPTVQVALSRLLGAAAPPGAAARENRRQCLKVLRLWLERKILPESILRGHMDNIGASNDDASSGFFPKRPSRAERSIDDPIREMEGMLVDEYGSNATLHEMLPGFLSSHVFEEEEEDDIPSISFKGVDGSLVEPSPATAEPETYSVTPNDRRHCILEDVDGELEMEDVSGHPKDEINLTTDESFDIESRNHGSERNLVAASNSFDELSPLYEGSPPLPLDSPPPTPPLPSSPPPPPRPVLPPPPLSPSPPPLPLPTLPSQAHPLPTPHSGLPQSLLPQPSIPPQPSTSSQILHPYQPSISSSSPNMAFHPTVQHEYSGTAGGHQLGQVTANTRYASHIDGALRSEMFPQQPSYMLAGVCGPREPSGFSSSRSMDYANDTYTNPQGSHSSQQFQARAPLPQRVFHPTPPPQAPSGHFSYSNPTMQHHLQHPYAPPYSVTKHADGPRQYGADEQWRMPTNEFNNDSQRGAWVNGGRSSLPSGPSFAPEGYFRPPVERPSSNAIGFQPSGINAVPTGAPVPGHNGSMMMPSRPDMSSLNCWRPA